MRRERVNQNIENPIASLLEAADAVIDAWATDDPAAERRAMASLIRARASVGEVKATNEQLLSVLENQIRALYQPLWNEAQLCQLLGCSASWLWRERKQGRWLQFESDTRGNRFYTREQILSNLRNEKTRAELRAA